MRPLRRWGSLLPRSAKVAVAGGSASADFQVWQVPSAGATVGPILATLAPGQKTPKLKREFGYLAQVSLQGVTVRLPAASGGDVRLNSARAEVTPQGVQILDLDGSWQGFPVRASGWIYDLSHPRADLHLRATGVDLAAVRRRLPASLTKGLNGDLRDRDEEEVRGYREALRLIHEQSSRFEISEETILRLHALIRGEIWDAGRYKEKDGDITNVPDKKRA